MAGLPGDDNEMGILGELSKIGIFLIGVSLLIMAGLAVYIYLSFIQRAPMGSPFNAYCSPHNAVIIHANTELKEVRVYDNGFYAELDEDGRIIRGEWD